VGLHAAFRGTEADPRWGTISLYGNAMLLDAEFVSGPQKHFRPQHAPGFLIRSGAIYKWRDRFKLGLLGTFVDHQYADDNNTSSYFIPSYTVWDLTFEAKLGSHFSLLAGINNLLDEDYYARIRAEGIDPAYRRNFYAGFAVSF